jgi:hypothetical protein
MTNKEERKMDEETRSDGSKAWTGAHIITGWIGDDAPRIELAGRDGMTKKDIAERLREIIAYQQHPYTRMEELADELDPPRPEPGTVVWCHQESWPSDQWEIATSAEQGVYITGHGAALPWDSIRWKPARILADDEVAVKVPLVREWPDDSECVEVALIYDRHTHLKYAQHVITRAEAEAREAGDDNT